MIYKVISKYRTFGNKFHTNFVGYVYYLGVPKKQLSLKHT